jgi:ATP-dependent Clp protease ATP-binding subunit ClpC
MTEFAEGFSISKMLGSPAGYVGHKESTTLVDRIRRQPLSVIVFDEIDKAHPDVLNILLQILEEGRLTDATGKEANVKQSIIILTHQIAYEEAAGSQFGFGNRGSASSASHAPARTSTDIAQSLRTSMRPELLNRIDSVCVFQPLGLSALAEIAAAELTDLAARVSKRNIVLTWDETTPLALAETITNARDGARSVRHTTHTLVEQPLIDAYIADEALNKYHVHNKNGILGGLPTYGQRSVIRTTKQRISRTRERTSARV